MRITSYILLVALMAVVSFIYMSADAYAWSGLKTDSNVIDEGEFINLRWNIEDGVHTLITPEVGTVENQGVMVLKPEKTTTYILMTKSYRFGQLVPITYELTVSVVPR